VKKIKDNFITGAGRLDTRCILAGSLGEGATVPQCLSLVTFLWASKESDNVRLIICSRVQLLPCWRVISLPGYTVMKFGAELVVVIVVAVIYRGNVTGLWYGFDEFQGGVMASLVAVKVYSYVAI
jgi:hypothetical protein